MFDPTSRYARLETATITVNGRTVSYVRRRFLPRAEDLTLIGWHVVRAGERLDSIAATEIGDPAQFWQVADANGATEPGNLVTEPGRRLRITLPATADGGPTVA